MAIDPVLEGLERRDPAALARAISLVENQRDDYERVLSHAHARLGRGGARRVGITGPPGAGKSTLTERLIQHYRGQELRVGVIAVDPTSPFTGGALLGDRIRIETVGVGQTELDVARSAETTVLVLVPESGDGIQTLKAGVMEIADVYVVNKSDRPGADKLRQEVEVMLGIRRGNAFRHVAPHHRSEKATERPEDGTGMPGEWEAPVLATVASKGEGVDGLAAALDRHYAYLEANGRLAERRRQRLAARTRAVLDRSVRRWISEATRADELLASRLDDVADGRKSPYDVAAEILDQMKTGAGGQRGGAR